MSQLPLGWVQERIGVLCRLINGRAFKPSDWTTDGVPIVRIQNLNDTEAKFNRFRGDTDARFLIDSGELLFAWSGTPGTSFGAHIWERGPAILNQHIFRVRFDETTLDKRFLKYAINDRLDHLVGVAHGGAGLAHVTKPVFEATEVTIPPLAEQKRIVAKVEDLTGRSRRAREALDALPPLLDQLRQSILAAAFRGALTADWRRSHNTSLDAAAILAAMPPALQKAWRLDQLRSDSLPPSWLRVPFGLLVRSIRTGTTAVPADDKTELSVLRSSAVRPGVVDLDDARFLDPTQDHNEQNFLQDDDLLFTRLSGSREYVANCARVRGLRGRRIQYPDRLFRAQLIDSAMAPYLEACFGWREVHEEIVGRTKSTAGHQRVSTGAIMEQFIPLAPMDEQREIARRLRNMSASLQMIAQHVGESIEHLRALDASVLSKAFRGELVPQDPNDQPASVLIERIRGARDDERGKVSDRPRQGSTKSAQRL